MKTIGSVDIGGTKLAVGAVREDGRIVKQCECPTEPEKGFQQAMKRVATMLRALTDSGVELAGIGVGCPGPLDPFSGEIGDVGTLPGWQGGNLVDELQSEFGLPVAVENDADAAALGEARWGSDASSGNFMYVTISTGIGGGMILDGRLYRGVDGAHPEIGHQVLDASGPQCYCGARGCWEILASSISSGELFVYMTATGLALSPVALLMGPGFHAGSVLGFGLTFAIQSLNAVGCLLFVYAVRLGKAIVVVPMINGLFSMVTIIVLLLIYREIPSRYNSAGMVLALTAVLLMAFDEVRHSPPEST
jgi:hypothetical protein